MWSYNFGWHRKQHCCNKQWLLLNAWEIVVNAFHSNELSALRNTFYPEYKLIINYNVYNYIHTCKNVASLPCFLSVCCSLFYQSVFFFLVFKGSWAKETLIYSFLQYQGKPSFRLLINLCNMYLTRLERNGPKNDSIMRLNEV